ncbi:hypothetical protein FHP05_08620 [Cerasibacillus terrae]|uniref:Uncharacterized protein n=1 Tax=Cerasibacillus terrae TaxID=2498845 RepID=A0A5C8NRQ6_9BACI|nr:hypothetical protein [Cerasibacillus terrae]TXL64381.1 hypothetical protein FHP05_08620 [Cerasibacillus terrae]
MDASCASILLKKISGASECEKTGTALSERILAHLTEEERLSYYTPTKNDPGIGGNDEWIRE